MKTELGRVRPVSVMDAEAFRTFILQLDTETKFMLFEPGERSDSIDFYRTSIESGLKDTNRAWFVAEVDGRIIGFLSAVRGPQNRVRHRAYIVMGVLAECHRQGVAKRLFRQLFEWAKQNQVERIELTVVADNAPAIALYTGLGFRTEGLRKHSVKIDGQWADEYAMAKLMSETE